MSHRILHPTFIGLLVLAMVAGIPFAGRAACPPTDLQSQFSAADIVATGTVYSIVTLDTGGSEIYVDPVTIYKGAELVADSFIVAVPEQPADGVAFAESDEPFLLFLKTQDDETFATDACAGSRPLGPGLTDAEKAVLGMGIEYAVTLPTIGEGDELPVDELADIITPSVEPIEQRAATWVSDHRPLAIALALWILLSHGLALWAAGRLRQRGWFIALFVVPTVGLLPIVYLALIGKAAFHAGGPPTNTTA